MVSRRMKGGERPHLGLGLYVVRTVAERHGGKAEASNLDQGVRFRVCLPLELSQNREPDLEDLPQIKLEA
jgi:signal transduction histidine kinase